VLILAFNWLFSTACVSADGASDCGAGRAPAGPLRVVAEPEAALILIKAALEAGSMLHAAAPLEGDDVGYRENIAYVGVSDLGSDHGARADP
jgi:hypothetical protein